MTETPTETLTPTAFASPFGAEPPLSLIFADNFDAGETLLWTLGAGWTFVASEGGQALQSTGDDAVTFANNNVYEAAAEARFLLPSGLTRLSLRQSEAGSYTALMDVSGNIVLYRGGDQMGTAQVSPLAPSQWRTLRLSAIGDIVRVSIDGVEVIAAQDTAPLPPGTISFAGISASGLLVDDFALWVTTEDLIVDTSVEMEAATSELFGLATVQANDVAALRAAITDANLNCNPSSPAVIDLAPVTYTLPDVVETWLGANGLPVIRCSLTINGNGAVIERAATASAMRIMGIEGVVGGATVGVVLNDLTIQNGLLDDTTTPSNNIGAGIFSFNANLTISASTITGNVVNQSGRGGGVAFLSPNVFPLDKLEINTGSVISENSSLSQGGGIWVSGPNLSIEHLITNTEIANNTAASLGGGLYIAGLKMALENTQVTHNQGQQGGGLYSNNATFIISLNSVIANNSASQSGGGIFQGISTLAFEIRDSQIKDNEAIVSGGGITSVATPSLPTHIVIDNTCITNNSHMSATFATVGSQTTATNNWWGATNGPWGLGTGDGDSVSGNVQYSSFVTVKPVNCDWTKPVWTENGVVIQVDQPIPDLIIYDPCTAEVRKNNDADSKVFCSILAYNQYMQNLGGSMTWGQFISLVLYAEGHALLLGQNNGGTVVYGSPQSLGICWRLVGTETWLPGADQCNVPTSTTAPGVQNDFTYAVWEWLFNECAFATGFVDASGQRSDYEKDGIRYADECNENGFVSFLSKVNRLYIDTTFSYNPTLYLPRVREEFVKWEWTDANPPPRYRYGICPCTWGNVSFEKVSDAPSPEVQEYAAQRNDGRSYNNGWSFSYFYWDAEDATDPKNRYFKVY